MDRILHRGLLAFALFLATALSTFGEDLVATLDSLSASADAERNAEAHALAAKHVNSPDTAVAVAAIRAVGRIGTRRGRDLLMHLSDPKVTGKRKPAQFAAALWALRFYGPEDDGRIRKRVAETARKWLTRTPPEPAQNACATLGYFPQRQAVENLIELMTLTRRKEVQPFIVGSLERLTGWDFEDASAWSRYWESRKDTWSPDREEVDPKTLSIWEDPGYGFRIELPAGGWHFRRDVEHARIQLKWDLPRTEGEPVQGAAINVSAYDAVAYGGATPRSRAAERERWFRENWKETKDWETDHEHVIGTGRDRIVCTRQRFTGRNPSGRSIWTVNYYLLHEGMLITLGTWVLSGNPTIRDEARKAVESFRLLK